MKFSYNWLKKISATKKSPLELKDLLINHSFEVEKVIALGENWKKVVVGEILEIKKHPDADRLQLVKVNIGERKKLEVVCGAFNISLGDKVPVAMIGASLPNGMVIKETNIRGVKSQGMLCAPQELGLEGDPSGILILNKNISAGISLAQALGLDDFILEIDILANRGHDALSHVGVAREIAALENRKIDYDWLGLKAPRPKTKKEIVKTAIKDKKLCPRYSMAVLEDVAVAPSPLWLAAVLKNCGLNSVNNVVDVTNYVMLEIGQPLHSFDVEKLYSEKGKIFIEARRATKGEKIKLLNEKVYDLEKEDLIISDRKNPIALAGIMGGWESKVTEKTRTIILEAANFDAISIRSSRLRHNLKTDASDRFEKTLDPNLTEKALARAVEMLVKIAGGKLVQVEDIYPKKVHPWKISLNIDYLEKMLGEKIPIKTAREILNRLEIKTKLAGKVIVADIPTFRLDLQTPEDLVEEIGRVYGYEKITPQPLMAPVKNIRLNENRLFIRAVKNILAGSGFSEVYNYSFYSMRDAGLAYLGNIKHLELENPMNPDQAWLRVSLIPGILKNIRENLKNFQQLRLFETGRVYWKNADVLPEEKEMLVGAIVAGEKFGAQIEADSFYEAKGQVDNLLAKLNLEKWYYDDYEPVSADTFVDLWHQGRSAEIKLEDSGESIGFLGEVNPFVLANFGIRERVALFELNLEKLRKFSEGEREYAPLRKYPEVTRDISMIVSGGTRVNEILSLMQAAGGALLLDVDLFDIFYFEKENKKSMTFHLIFGAPDRTLESREVESLLAKIITVLEKKLGVKVRR